jgi:hypothetical protein
VNWPLNCQERLAALLVRACPYQELPDDDDSSWGRDLWRLRDTVIDSLIQNSSAEHVAAMDRLAGLDPYLGQIVLGQRASSSATQVIQATAPNAIDDPSALPFQTARRLLDRQNFRLVRSADDLLDAVLFALQEIQGEVGHDLPLLYSHPRDVKQTKGESKQRSESERKHLHEDALQAYLRRRLKDVLARVVERVEVQILREDQVAYRRRFDLRITAPCLGTQHLATVVVEIKWSTNSETRTALDDQLGKKYLLGEQLTHGVFLVGWSGCWQPGQRRRKSHNLNELVDFLRNQRDEFCRAGHLGEGVRIEPFVLNLAWRQSLNYD